MYPGQEKAIFDMYNNHPEAASAVVGPILEDKVVNHLLDKLDLKEKKCSAKELIAIDEEPFDFFKDDAEQKPAKKKPVQRKDKSESSTEKAPKKIRKKAE
jgi:hypothetical protein